MVAERCMTAQCDAIIVFARMNSTRLPGKMMAEVGGMPLLEWVLRRAQQLSYPLILATSTCSADGALVEVARQLGVAIHRGSETDVLERALDCAQEFGLRAFARLCGDRPLFDAEEMRVGLVQIGSSAGAIDLVSNCAHRRVPPGLTTEVLTLEALRRAVVHADARAHEHLTSGFYERAQDYRIEQLPGPHACLDDGQYAIDSEDDLQRLRAYVACRAGAARTVSTAWLWAVAEPPATAGAL